MERLPAKGPTGKYTEEMFFEGDQSAFNPMRYLPTPFHTKFAQERTALSQYIQQEAIGTRMRRWERPIHDFLMPYLRGTVARADRPGHHPRRGPAPPRSRHPGGHGQTTWFFSSRPFAGFSIRSRAFPDAIL